MSGKIPYGQARGEIPFEPARARKRRLTNGTDGPYLVGQPRRQPSENQILRPMQYQTNNYMPQQQPQMQMIPKPLINVNPRHLNHPSTRDVKFMKTSKYSTAIPAGSNGEIGVTNLINQINAERNLKAREKSEKEMTFHNLVHANEMIEMLTSKVKALEVDNLQLTNELNRAAHHGGGVYDAGANHITTRNELELMNRVKQVEEELFKIKDENERIKVINFDLKRIVNKTTQDPELNGFDDEKLDMTYMEMKHKNIIESLDARCESLRKKNKMLQSENEMLRSELRTVCATDTNLQDKFIFQENNNLRRKINEMKNERNAMEIQLNNMESQMMADRTKPQHLFDGEGGRIRHDFEVLKFKYAEAKKKLYEFEKGEKKEEKDMVKDIQEYIKMMRQLENENDRLKRMLKDTDIAPKMLQRKGDEIMILQENRRLKDDNKLLKEEARANQNLIQRLKSSRPGNGTDLVAMESLRQANQRLLQQVMKLQEAFDSSMNRTNMAATGGVEGGPGGNDQDSSRYGGLEPVMIKSEWERV